jgi:hypothetical protein
MSDSERSNQRSDDLVSPRGARQEIELADMSEKLEYRDPLYLFACHLEWRNRGNLAAYQELLAALGDPDCDIRVVAEVLLHRDSQVSELAEKSVESGEVGAEFLD